MRTLLALLILTCPVFGQVVKVAPYYGAGAGTSPLTTSATTDSSIDWLAGGNTDRTLIPRTGSITKVGLYIADRTAISALYVGVCRWTSGTTWTVVQWTPTLGPLFSNEVNYFTLATPLSANKYDTMCGRIEWTTPHATNLGALSMKSYSGGSGSGNTISPEQCYYQMNAAKPTTLVTASMTNIATNGCALIEAWMVRPDIVGMGDSIIQKDDSVADGGAAIAWPISGGSNGQSGLSIPHYLAANYSGLTYQNMGWGGQTAVQIQARFAQDVLPLKPSYVVIDGGVNDVFLNCSTTSGCTGPQITTIENALAAMMQAAQTAGIKAYIMLVGPWTGNGSDATNAQMTSIDTLNGQTITNAATYGATVIDQRCVIGQFRTGGSAGNCWDFQTAYLNTGDGLGVHPNTAGDQQIVNLIQLARSNPSARGGTASLNGTAKQQ